MTDYERDLMNWEIKERSGSPYGPDKMPVPEDYDENGYRKGSVKYEDGLVLDQYLVQMYGIEYAKKNPIGRV
jgi:hypothetical protein